MQERAAGPSCPVDNVFGQDLNVRAVIGVFVRDDIYQAAPTPADPDDAMTRPHGSKRHGTNGWIEARHVAAPG